MIRVLAFALVLILGGCGWLGLGADDRLNISGSRIARERSVDPSRAAELINAQRTASGAAPLVVDPALNAVAAQTARELAQRDRLKTDMHTAAGLGRRLRAASYDADRAAENLGAGYPTLAMAVDGWKASRGHRKNLVNPELTRMGIGLALTDKGEFHSYWVLVLAKPKV